MNLVRVLGALLGTPLLRDRIFLKNDVGLTIILTWIMFRCISLFLMAVIFCSCTKNDPYIQHQGMALGTTYSIIYESSEGKRYGEEIQALLDRFEDCLSIYRPGSLISRMNQNDTTVRADDWFRKVFETSVRVSKESGGAFDITVAPLVNYWGFGFKGDSMPVPDSLMIDSLLQFVGMDKVWMEGNRLIKADPGVILDMNAVAKGFASDVVAEFLAGKGCVNFLVEIGGEIHAQGVNRTGVAWRVGIDKPQEGLAPGEVLQLKISLDNRSLATSGNYRKYHEVNGVKYAHTIDPSTGFPTRHRLLSATILASTCMEADAWATACMASGPEKSKVLLAAHPELDACLMISNDSGEIELFVTPGLDKITIKE